MPVMAGCESTDLQKIYYWKVLIQLKITIRQISTELYLPYLNKINEMNNQLWKELKKNLKKYFCKADTKGYSVTNQT